MKIRNYERMERIVFGIILTITIELIGILYLFQKKEFSYQLLSGIVIKKDYALLMVTKKEKREIYQNSFLYFNNRKRKYKVIENHGKILTKNKKEYYELVLKFSFSDKKKANDVLEIVIPKKKYRKIEIFKKIIGGG